MEQLELIPEVKQRSTIFDVNGAFGDIEKADKNLLPDLAQAYIDQSLQLIDCIDSDFAKGVSRELNKAFQTMLSAASVIGFEELKYVIEESIWSIENELSNEMLGRNIEKVNHLNMELISYLRVKYQQFII